MNVDPEIDDMDERELKKSREDVGHDTDVDEGKQ